MLQALQTRSNVRVINLVTGGDSNGDTQITSLAFGLVYENDDFIPNTGTSADVSSTLSTKVGWIQDKIAEALSGTHTENMIVYEREIYMTLLIEHIEEENQKMEEERQKYG